MTLQILLVTYNERINNVPLVLLKPMENVSYLVSWQQLENCSSLAIPDALLARNDVNVIITKKHGGSHNRNHCLDAATADICLLADDDLVYFPDAFANVLKVFEENSDIDLATFRYISDAESRVYPSTRTDLSNKIPGYSPVAFEIAFRRTSVQGRIRFNELFGFDAPVLSCGEDDVFVFDALKHGLSCVFFPITITKHSGPTTATSRIAVDSVLMARGAYLYLAYRKTMYLRAIRIAQVLYGTHRVGFFQALRGIVRGIFYAKANL